jgi:hypothetical protein
MAENVDRVAAVFRSRRISTAAGAPWTESWRRSDAALKGAKLVVFPETFVPWYPYFSFVHPAVLTGAEHVRLYENAVVVPGPATEAMAAPRAATESSSRSASTSATTARSTIRSLSSTPMANCCSSGARSRRPSTNG